MGGEERVDVVDEHDSVVSESTLGECLKRGLLHRAVAVVVSRPDGRVLLQRRSLKDPWQPGMWTLSCTGHVKKGESYRDAAVRELAEELGLRSSLEGIGRYLIPPIREGALVEREWVSLFAASSDASARIDLAEVETVAEFDREELNAMMESGELTPDAAMLLHEYLRLSPGRG
ncbi:MAG: NUDIX domain-containing protein [Nitrososphaerota archaeon]|nr:NUDIX domain-containing protein [Nitrososphaerota archaeon]MDG6941804.1 NUDIX domain-containing protein [Nitrososphaerota archaeon]MDG6947023.1 NUDIX domain-containing protein [Nitrososphaerota archaeon]